MIRYDPVFVDEGGMVHITFGEVTARLKSLASWLEQLDENDMLVSKDEMICYADNPHRLAMMLRTYLPAESRA